MNELLILVKKLKKSKIKTLVNKKIKEFKSKKSNNELFKELCFCILTANFNAERTIKIQNKIGNKFLTLSKPQLAKELKKLGHRFPNTRANYIIEARKYKNSLKKSREWLVKHIKGIGYKESSHFLRNIGIFNYALIDFHILDLLSRYKLMSAKLIKAIAFNNYKINNKNTVGHTEFQACEVFPLGETMKQEPQASNIRNSSLSTLFNKK